MFAGYHNMKNWIKSVPAVRRLRTTKLDLSNEVGSVRPLSVEQLRTMLATNLSFTSMPTSVQTYMHVCVLCKHTWETERVVIVLYIFIQPSVVGETVYIINTCGGWSWISCYWADSSICWWRDSVALVSQCVYLLLAPRSYLLLGTC